MTPTELKESDIAINTVPKTTPPAVPAQIRRTVSVGNTNAPFFTNVRRDVLDGYLLAIGLAEELIYIENQYLREAALGKAIIDRHKKNAVLRTIIVLPTRSEELVRKKGDPVTKAGAALQWKIIDDMQKQIGSNVGFFAMERKDKHNCLRSQQAADRRRQVREHRQRQCQSAQLVNGHRARLRLVRHEHRPGAAPEIVEGDPRKPVGYRYLETQGLREEVERHRHCEQDCQSVQIEGIRAPVRQ